MDAHNDTKEPLPRCLFIPEILNHICTQFDEAPGRRGRGRRRALNALARTCHAFQETAMDHLWSELPDLVLLIKCMASDLWCVDRYSGALRLNRTTFDSDWPRFLEYSRRVKKIGPLPSSLFIKDYAKLVPPSSCNTLFPNAREVCWDEVMEGELRLFPWYMGPNVESLSIRIPPFSCDVFDFQTMATTIAALQPRCPLVRRVSFIAKPRDGGLNPILTIVTGWTLLKYLEIGGIATETFSSIASLPNLHTLILHDQSFTVLPAASGPVFPQLQVLNITTESLPFCTDIVQCFHSTALRSISISLFEPGAPSAWKAFFAAVAAHCKTSTFTSLCINEQCSPPDDGGPAPQRITIDTLSPLLALPNLEVVGLSFQTPYDLDAAATTDLALAWPRLTTLNMCPLTVHETHPPRLALHVFVPFMMHCARLQRLDIYVDASHPDPQLATPPPPGRIGVFPHLGVGLSWIADPGRVVEELRRVFPGGIGVLEADHVWDDPMWPEVAEQLKPQEGEGEGREVCNVGVMGDRH